MWVGGGGAGLGTFDRLAEDLLDPPLKACVRDSQLPVLGCHQSLLSLAKYVAQAACAAGPARRAVGGNERGVGVRRGARGVRTGGV